MSIDIPDFLIELSKQMNSDPSRSTAHPFWQVRCKQYIITEEGYNEHHWELVDEEGETIYSTEPYHDNKATTEDFYEKNKSWCDEWIEENTEIEFLLEDDTFYDFFCFSDHKESWEDWPDGYKVVHFQEVEKIVWTGLTQSAAEQFIARKQHDYPKLYTHVESAYWSPQFVQLQEWIKSLTKRT